MSNNSKKSKFKLSKELLQDIAYIDPETLEKKPMDVVEPIECPYPQSEFKFWVDQLEDLKKSISRWNYKSISYIRNYLNEEDMSAEGTLFLKLFELNNLDASHYEEYLQILELKESPLFVRIDSVNVNNKAENKMPSAVEFQYRIGGLGFHQAVNDIFSHTSIKGVPMVENYAKCIRKFWKEKFNSNEPFIQLLVPHFKSAEVFYWADRLDDYGIKSEVVFIDNINKAIKRIYDLYKIGARLIFRREFHLPALIDNELGGKNSQ